MSELTNTQYAALFTQMAQEMGVTPDKVAASFARHQERGEIVLSLPSDPIAQAQQALPILGRALDGKLARAELTPAFSILMTGLFQTQKIEETPEAATTTRPREQDLTEGLDALADATKKLPQEMFIAKVDAPSVHAQSDEIRFLRGFLGELLIAADLVLDNLTVKERRAADDMGRAYALVRPAARSNRRLGELLQPTEDYLFGAQKLGAEVRAKNRTKEMALTDKATKRARLEAGGEARRDLANNLSAALEALGDRRSEDRGEPLGR